MMKTWTLTDLKHLYDEHSGHADFPFTGHEIDQIAILADGTVLLTTDDGEPLSLLGARLTPIVGGYRWQLSHMESRIVNLDRMRVVHAVRDAESTEQLSNGLTDLIAEA